MGLCLARATTPQTVIRLVFWRSHRTNCAAEVRITTIGIELAPPFQKEATHFLRVVIFILRRFLGGFGTLWLRGFGLTFAVSFKLLGILVALLWI